MHRYARDYMQLYQLRLLSLEDSLLAQANQVGHDWGRRFTQLLYPCLSSWFGPFGWSVWG